MNEAYAVFGIIGIAVGMALFPIIYCLTHPIPQGMDSNNDNEGDDN